MNQDISTGNAHCWPEVETGSLSRNPFLATIWHNHSQMAIPQIAQVPMQMGVPTAQIQNNPSDTAMMGHMRDVIMQMNNVTVGDNPCYMEMSEIPREGEPALNF